MKLTEKQKNCPYCHEDKENTLDYYRKRSDVALDKTLFGKPLSTHTDISIGIGYEYGISTWRQVYGAQIYFCPMCGRPLNKEES